MLWAWLPRKSGGAIQGRIQDFPNWGVETHDTKSGGWGEGGGFCTLQARYEMGEGGRGGYRIFSSRIVGGEGGRKGAVCFWPDTKCVHGFDRAGATINNLSSILATP